MLLPQLQQRRQEERGEGRQKVDHPVVPDLGRRVGRPSQDVEIEQQHRLSGDRRNHRQHVVDVDIPHGPRQRWDLLFFGFFFFFFVSSRSLVSISILLSRLYYGVRVLTYHVEIYYHQSNLILKESHCKTNMTADFNEVNTPFPLLFWLFGYRL